MPVTFCQACGADNHYKNSRPKLCCQCGKSFGGIAPVVKPKVVEKRTVVVQEEEKEFDTYSDFANTFSNTEVQVTGPNKLGELRNLIGSEKPSARREKKLTKKQIEERRERVQREGKNTGESTEIGGKS